MHKNKKKYICFGGRSDGHFNAVKDLLEDDIELEVLDNKLEIGSETLGHKIIGGINEEINIDDYDGFILGVGDNIFRKKCFLKGLEKNLKSISLIHKSATISKNATIGRGVYIGPGVIIGSNVEINDATILNSGAIIEHDSKIESYVHIAPGVKIAGRVKIEELAFIGIGSCIIPDITIGMNAVIGAGATVVNDVNARSKVIGIKAMNLEFVKNNIYKRILESNP